MTVDLFKTRWRAHYKNGLHNTTIVYGRSMEEAKRMALAEYRKSSTAMSMLSVDEVVDYVSAIDPLE